MRINQEENKERWAFWLFMAWIVLSAIYSITVAIINPESGGPVPHDYEQEFLR